MDVPACGHRVDPLAVLWRAWIRIGVDAMSLSRLADVLYAEEVARARAMSPADKLLEGPRLFERACRLMIDGIRHRHPELDEQGIQALLAAMLERLDTADHS